MYNSCKSTKILQNLKNKWTNSLYSFECICPAESKYGNGNLGLLFFPGGHSYACMCCHHQAGLQISPSKYWPLAGENSNPNHGPACEMGTFSLTSCIWPIWTPFSLTYIKKVPLSTDLQKKKKKKKNSICFPFFRIRLLPSAMLRDDVEFWVPFWVRGRYFFCTWLE